MAKYTLKHFKTKKIQLTKQKLKQLTSHRRQALNSSSLWDMTHTIPHKKQVLFTYCNNNDKLTSISVYSLNLDTKEHKKYPPTEHVNQKTGTLNAITIIRVIVVNIIIAFLECNTLVLLGSNAPYKHLSIPWHSGVRRESKTTCRYLASGCKGNQTSTYYQDAHHKRRLRVNTNHSHFLSSLHLSLLESIQAVPHAQHIALSDWHQRKIKRQKEEEN